MLLKVEKNVSGLILTCTWNTNGWGIIMYLNNQTELDMKEKDKLCNITVTAL